MTQRTGRRKASPAAAAAGRTPAAAADRRRVVKVAIVGGGCAGMTAAWELCKRNLQPGDAYYDITVYEKDSRLGGKGSSVRDADGRILEHGLHIWLGFYENAFRMMREAYGEAGLLGMGPNAKDPALRLPIGRFEDAFSPESHVGVASRAGNGDWESWTGHLPPMKGMPGEALDAASNPFTLAAYLSRCVGLSLALMHSVVGPADPEAGAPRPDGRSASDEATDLEFDRGSGGAGGSSSSLLLERAMHWLEVGALTTTAGLLQAVTIVETWLGDFDPMPGFDSTILKFLQTLAAQVRKRLRKLVGVDPHLRRKTEIIDLIITIVVGLYRDRVLFDQERGLDAIDDIDCRDWLRKHGALKSSVDSPFVVGLYDLAFCYADGDRSRPALAAGQALRGALRMFFTYRGSIFWRMRSGMGETVFSPLYRVLASTQRHLDGRPVDNPYPVRFRFGHALRELSLVPQGDKRLALEAMSFECRGPAEVALDAFGCWRPPPARAGRPKPLRLTRRAHRHDDAAHGFDCAVFALGIDDFRQVMARSRPPADADYTRRLGHMFAQVKTIATQAAQVWLNTSLHDLGWTRGSVLMSGCESPLETWADMSHTLPSEQQWRVRVAGSRPSTFDASRSVMYFCGTLPQSQIDKLAGGKSEADPAQLDALVRQNLAHVLESERMLPYWPRTRAEKHRAVHKLVGGLQAQHVRANAEGSERYTLAVPGSARYRISPLDDSVVNLTLAGDWTDCGFNEGCVEAAVMSGMLAAHAISLHPALEDIIGYDHP